ncbi:MAG: zinc-dependent alcohol dehydrogenase family protein [Anaerolineales bacterium]|nr:zinc-dependent alcohol dehydrogenase family protein [Anaerolineales bacterium]MBS3752718.1 zinc-dependent alcohol dehydrogenase family protein [Anaerolineales bacterium]
MKAMQFSKPSKIEEEPLELVQIEKPEPGPGQIRLKVHMCGVCHTDLHIAEGDIHPSKSKIIPGHQVVGEVDALGKDVKKFSKGDRVGVPWFYDACGECVYCKAGKENLCEDARFTGFDVNGGFAEFMTAEAAYTLPLPPEMSDRQTAPLLCAGIIGYRSLHQAEFKHGERLGLIGFGASAHLTIQVAHHWEGEVFVFTRAEEHREHARRLGAAWVGGIEDQIPGKLDCAIIFAPAGHLVPKVLEKLRPGGTLAINAIHMSPIPEMPYRLIYDERTLRSVANATYQDGVEYLTLAAEIPVEATTQVYPLREANQALEDIKHSAINGEALLKIS